MWRGPRRKLSQDEVEANQRTKLVREQATMTCQCCARKHLANRGWIAHHGYTRPYEGWQTASCMGAKYLPFEVDRQQLAELIHRLIITKARMIANLENLKANAIGITLTHSFKDYRTGNYQYGMKPVTREVKFKVNCNNFADVMKAEDNEQIFITHMWYNWETVKANGIASRELDIKHITRDIEEQQKRYNGWKQTHRWNGKEWEGV